MKGEGRRQSQKVGADGRKALSHQQNRVMCLYALGWSRTDIVDWFGVNPKTIERHVSQARLRLGAKTIHQAVAIWYARAALDNAGVTVIL